MEHPCAYGVRRPAENGTVGALTAGEVISHVSAQLASYEAHDGWCRFRRCYSQEPPTREIRKRLLQEMVKEEMETIVRGGQWAGRRRDKAEL